MRIQAAKAKVTPKEAERKVVARASKVRAGIAEKLATEAQNV